MSGSREMGKPPWDVALLAQVRMLEQRVMDAAAERDQLLVDNHQLTAKLSQCQRQCRERLENWKLRQAAWRRERDELLAHREPPRGKPS